MTTNWREKLEAAADQDIDDLGFVVGPEKVLLSDALALLERAYSEGRADGCEAASKVVDEILDRGWPDVGDRPSSPPAVLLAVATRLSALAAVQKGTP